MSTTHEDNEQQQRETNLQRMGRLAGALAHEIKNPLSTMNISLQLLKEDLEAKPQVSSASVLPRIRLMSDEIRHLEKILDSFLQIARAPVLELAERDPNELIRNVLTLLAPELTTHGITVHAQFDTGIGIARMDPDLMRQTLLNLLRNAIQAMPQGGTLTVLTRREGSHWTLELIDTGCGIPLELQPRVFEAFFTTRKGGTGIGLALVRGIVERHGGQISLQSAEGMGTRFLVRMPAPAVEGSVS
jgi:signal transduction histidine kinase